MSRPKENVTVEMFSRKVTLPIEVARHLYKALIIASNYGSDDKEMGKCTSAYISIKRKIEQAEEYNNCPGGKKGDH